LSQIIIILIYFFRQLLVAYSRTDRNGNISTSTEKLTGLHQ
jgi:hypothetical protein